MKIDFVNGIFKISGLDSEHKISKNFAEKLHSSVKDQYYRRNQTNDETIINQKIQGTLAEFAVSGLLKSFGLTCSKDVDTKIYHWTKKTYGADLEFGDIKINVKSQTFETRKRGTPLSWLLQYSGEGKGHTDPLFNNATKPNEYLALTYLEKDSLGNYVVAVVGVINVPEIFASPNLIKLPERVHLRDTKRALYYSDLKKLGDSFLWKLFKK